MANIIISVEEFQCESPIIGTTYRQGGNYIFNWTTKGNEYNALGLVAEIRLFYIPETTQPEEPYTAQAVPFNADNFDIGPLPYDQTSFRLEFLVDGGDTCYYSIDIPYSSIIIL